MKTNQRSWMLTAICVLSLVFTTNLASAKDWQVDAYSQLWSNGITDAGFNRSKGHAAVETDLAITYKSLTFEIFNASVLGDEFRKGPGNELDFIVSWKGKMMDNYDITLGIAYVDYPNIFSGHDGDQLKPFAEVSRDFKLSDTQTIAPYARAEFAYYLNGDGFNNNYYLGVKHSVNFTPNLKLDTKVAAVYDDGGKYFDSGLLALAQTTLNYSITKNFSADLISLKATMPISGANDRETEFAVGAGLRFTF
jgi:hypothetical protein